MHTSCKRDKAVMKDGKHVQILRVAEAVSRVISSWACPYFLTERRVLNSVYASYDI